MKFIRSSILRDYTVATEVKKIDLPVNPLSHLIFSLAGWNVTDEATLAEILAFINSITVSHRGTTICYAESEDLAALNCRLFRAHPILTQNIATDNATRVLSLIIPFGRRIFNPKECFPETKKGELTLSLDLTIPSASLDNAVMNIEAVEMLGAKPEQYLKYTTKNVQAPAATGDLDIDIPIGNQIPFILMYSTTFPTTSSMAFGINASKILINNVEYGYNSAKSHCMTGDWIFHLSTLPRSIAAFGQMFPLNYLIVDFDPVNDDQWLLDTKGASSAVLRNTMAVAEASRVCFAELVAASETQE